MPGKDIKVDAVLAMKGGIYASIIINYGHKKSIA